MASKADRIVGTILGAALGDAVGLCTEFLAFTTRWQKSYWFMYNTYIIYDIIFIYIYATPPWKVYRFHVVVELKGNLYYILLYYIILYYIILYYILSYFSILQYIIYIYIWVVVLNIFYVHPYLGKMVSHFDDHIFSKGLVQPPTTGRYIYIYGI